MDLREEEGQRGRIGARRQSGFTLIEITIAILILAVSLVTLLGLQSAAMRRALVDRNQQRAMLMARSILASIESIRGPVENQDRTGSPEEILSALGFPSSEEERSEMQAILKVDDWTVPGSKEALMKRVFLRIAWGENQDEIFDVIYFLPHEENTEAE